MSETASLTLDLPRDIVDGLESLAEQTGRDVSELAGEALVEYIRLQDRHIAAIQEAIAEIDAGAPMVSNDAVMAWLESWETSNELPRPR